MSPPSENTLKTRLQRFGRSTLVGILATVLDLSTYTLLFRLLHLPHFFAKFVSLTIGTTTQFVGSRHYAFHAQAGELKRQMKWFVLVELIAFGFTLLVYKGLHLLGLPGEIASLASGSVVYFGFSYPIWQWVFKLTPEELDRAANAAKPSSSSSPPASP